MLYCHCRQVSHHMMHAVADYFGRVLLLCRQVTGKSPVRLKPFASDNLIQTKNSALAEFFVFADVKNKKAPAEQGLFTVV